MYVRLAFAVAEFQKKCLGRMHDASVNDGRTVLFVSHNMAAIQKLCDRTIVLANGSFVFDGKTKQGIDFYLNSADNVNNACFLNEHPKASDILEIKILNEQNQLSSNFSFRVVGKQNFNHRVLPCFGRAICGSVMDEPGSNFFQGNYFNLISSRIEYGALEFTRTKTFL